MAFSNGFDRSDIPVGLVEPKIWDGRESIPKNVKSILKMDYTGTDIGDKSADRAGLFAIVYVVIFAVYSSQCTVYLEMCGQP